MAYEPTACFWQVVGYWQTLIAGGLAVAAAAATIIATVKTANREIAAAQEQTKTAQKQIETTLSLEQKHLARDSWAFLVALDAAASRTLEDIRAAREKVPRPATIAFSPDAYHARQQLKNPAFLELRSACIRVGGDVTPLFFSLDKEIELFAAGWREALSASGMPYKTGEMSTFHAQLDSIEKLAERVRDEAASGIARCRERLIDLGDES